MPKVGQRHTVSVDAWGSDGSGVCRVDGMAVFVKGGIVGETCVIELEHIGHSAAWAHIVELLTPSPARKRPPCPHYGQCGGCQTQHMSYDMELSFKSDKITQALRRIGGLDVAPVEVHGAPSPYGYRNKVQFPVGPGGQIGYFRQRTHTVIDVENCLLHHDRVNALRAAVKDWMEKFSIPPYDEKSHTGLLRHLYIRTNAQSQALVCLIANSHFLPHEQELVSTLRQDFPWLIGISLNVNTRRTNVVLGPETRSLWGQAHLEDSLCGLTFKLSPHSFYQVNHDQAQALYRKAADYAALTGTETVLDLYCGTGTIGLSLAQKAGQIVGVEVVPQAIRDAEDNAQRNGVGNARFLCADAAQAAAQLEREGLRPDVVVVDPPRKGLAPEVVETLRRMAPPKIVYVSCDPATLARDLKTLCQDYRLVQAEGYDLFPRTQHVETVCLLDKRPDGLN